MIWFKMPQIFFCRIDISATVTSQDSLGQTIPGTKTWGKGYSKWSDFLSKPEVLLDMTPKWSDDHKLFTEPH